MSEPEFGAVVHGTMDVEEPTGWVHLEAVLSVPEEGTAGAVRCLDVSATDESGVVLDLPRAEKEDFGRRFIEAFCKRGKRVFQPGR